MRRGDAGSERTVELSELAELEPAAAVAASDEQEPAGNGSLSRYLHQHLADIEALPTYRSTIGVIIPADNQAESIEGVLRGLLSRTRLPDEIHVIINDTKDSFFELAAAFAGPRKRSAADGPLAAPAPVVDTATVSPGHLIKKPNSYGNVFTVPELPVGAQSVTLTFTHQLLSPNEPRSKVCTKQVATDSVTVAIAS